MYGHSNIGLTVPLVADGANDLIRYTGPPPIPSVGAVKRPPPPPLTLYANPSGAGFPGPAALHGAAIPHPVKYGGF